MRNPLLPALATACCLVAGCSESQAPDTGSSPQSEPGPLAQALEAKASESAEKMPADVQGLFAKAAKELASSGALKRARNVGAKAPDFTLKDASGRPVALADLRARGPVVIAFYRGKW